MRLIAAAPVETESITLDEHIPISVRWGPARPGNLVYWRSGDHSTTLLEIGFDRDGGTLRSLTLACSPRAEAGSPSASLAALPRIDGVPRIDPREHAGMYVDEPRELILLRLARGVVMLLGERATVCRTITARRLRFGVDRDDRLVAIELFDLSDEEERHLTDILEGLEERGRWRDTTWVEAWIDTSSAEYLLLVRGWRDGRVVIHDPQRGHETVAAFVRYEDAERWLREDEYERIDGRRSPDDT